MDLLEEYHNRYDSPPTDPDKRLLFKIIGNLTSRRGFDHQWDDCDDDVKLEILETNLQTIKKERETATTS